ncbi:MAG: acetate--CoA ligase family protein [Anaerolineaceae bacterium]|nr:acetate--CoA ligase family protein [Anaerolineaceae bacterium]
MSDPSLLPFLKPQSVAIIGASRDPTKLGFGLARNLVQCGYPGAIYFINPRGGELLGQPLYTSISQAPSPVDLAVLLTPPAQVPDMLAECGQQGIHAAIIASGGFRETGAEGAALEVRCLEVAHAYGMRLIGPNCIGVIDTHLPLDTTFLQPPGPPRGEIAFISHSGAICAAVIDWVRGQGMGLSSLISLGNQVDVTETDMLELVAEDAHTRVLTLYMEGVSNGRRFAEQARRVSRSKPILALKVGRFESGQRAAASHTGALAGRESAFDAAFQQAGVVRVDTTEQMFQWARALAWCPLPKGRRVAILTNAGGPGVTAADALELNGLRIADLLESTREALRQILPPAASLHNPVDMLASASPEQYAGCLKVLLDDPGVDSVMIIFPPPPMFSAGQVAKTTIPVIQAAEKPVVIALMGDRLIQEAVEHYRASRIPEYRFPEWAASALGVLSRRTEFLACADERPLIRADVDILRVRGLLGGLPAGKSLSPETAANLLEAYGIPTLKVSLASSPQQAAEVAAQAGFPVVLKVASADISHKSDVGGVLLNLQNEAEVLEGYSTVIERARAARPQATIDGVHIQRMLPPGQDVIIGVVRDVQFGPLAMFGSGGVEVEGLKDVAFGLAPLYPEDVRRMFESTWAGRKLKGFRNLPPADRAAAQEALVRLAQLAVDFPQINEVEVNPLRVLPEGKGVFAVDVRGSIS